MNRERVANTIIKVSVVKELGWNAIFISKKKVCLNEQFDHDFRHN